MLGTLVLFALAMAVGVSLLVAIPLMLLKVVFTLVFLPFRILGGLMRALAGVVAGVAGIAASGVGLLLAVGGLLLGLVLLPLLPFLFVGALLWAALRMTRRPTAVRVVS
jgi:hypothetical protein